ncbi:type VI secretion system protein ImpL [Paraburkholderia sp. HC6.4b]|uniref:ImcF-related family protein n=1 Tax=unclassified Paraburkholderia TaxID=2615204 RepID=UPI00160D57FC|nr:MULTISPECIES: ImcF-related family protein [unclassified Paraburkholderia]MBB5409209.1 type VI secretion system protein ImpL [Paraburkholderia sp. HC6.4b]MBB5450937.1 type VI secretion system protein ImpL [Paraburkholderia sp. Kb1A]
MNNEKKYVWGLWIIAVAIIAVIVGVVAYTVDQKDLIAWVDRNRLVILAAAVLVLAALGFAFGRRKLAQISLQQASRDQGAEPPKPDDPAANAARNRAEQVATWAKDLKFQLRQKRWFRWAYVQPWLLVAGDSTAVTALVPELAQKGFIITDDVVLLWGALGADNRPDGLWLRRIRRLRRGRPIDAIALVLDNGTLLSESVHEKNPWGLHLARIREILRWSAPVFVLDVAGTDAVHRIDTPVTGCEFKRPLNASAVEAALFELRDRLADRSVHQLATNADDAYASDLSKRLETRATPLARWIAGLSDWQRRAMPVAGAFFAPLAIAGVSAAASSDTTRLALWRYLANAANHSPGRRTWSNPVTIASTIALALVGLWSAGMLISGMNNAHEVMLTKESLQALNRASDTPGRLRALLGLQQRIGLHEARVQEHTPLLTRFGLNHDRAILNALWTPYARAAKPLLVAPVQQDIEGQLVDLGQMSTAQVDIQSSQVAQDGQQALKTYLMMADPQRADPPFMTPQLQHHWNLDTGLRPGEKLDLSAQLMGFWAQHFPAHPDWRIQPREDLVGNARQTLLAIIGVSNSEDTIYQGILDSVGHKYPDQTLASLTAGTDTRGLFATSATVPGVFTRQAWEGSIEAAIDDAAKHNGVEGNWVLGNTGEAQAGTAMTPDALRAALRAHYFADYAEHWQDFMNGIRCEAAPTLPAAVGQLKLIADARQSPLIALMKSLAWQGGAGAQQASLSDALVTKAQNLFGKKDDAPQAAQAAPAGPLDASFGPVIKLVGQAGGNTAPAGGSDLSMERFTERVTTLRLKLQQISDSADPDDQARQIAQALFQGKGSELSDTLAYAQLVSASLGEQWAGMGSALFVQPIGQATQTVLRPAQASLNDAWRQTIVATWNRSFAGRYPFANTANDASLPEFARFVRPQGGLIGAFLSTQLAGALQLQGDQWVPASVGAGAGGTSRAFDPAFLKAINTLQQIAGHLLAQGEPQFSFELKPVPTPGVTDTLLTIDAQKLHYYNQQQTWQTMTWPSSDPQTAGTRLEWQTDTAGTNRSFEFGGRWALVRMLERAKVEPLDSATYQLTWQASPIVMEGKLAEPTDTRSDSKPDSNALTVQGPLVPVPSSMTHPLRYLIRTDVGRGPLELLALRGFTLPSRIFIDSTVKSAGQSAPPGPPPLPKAAREAAKHASVSLPTGIAPQ